MGIKSYSRLLGGVLVMLLSLSSNFVSFFLPEAAMPFSNPYPPSATVFQSASVQGSYFLYMPIIINRPEGIVRYYAQVEKSGGFYGIWATIETPDPDIREPVFSYASINIISPDGKWIEVGVYKGIYGYTDCIPKFSYAIQPGVPWIVSWPIPTVGVAYQYMVEKISDGHWFLRIMQTDGTVIFSTDIYNPGMNYGTKIQAAGEVNSPSMLNDMGVAGLLSLKWRMTNGNWSYWNGWTKGVEDDPPYQIVGVPPDTSNNVQISGNNGNPIPPSAPCP